MDVITDVHRQQVQLSYMLSLSMSSAGMAGNKTGQGGEDVGVWCYIFFGRFLQNFGLEEGRYKL